MNPRTVSGAASIATRARSANPAQAPLRGEGLQGGGQARGQGRIRVNAVAPGPLWTPLNPSDSGLTRAEVAKFGSHTPMGRPAQPDEIAPAYVFLASNGDSSYITGTVLQILGGETTGG